MSGEGTSGKDDSVERLLGLLERYDRPGPRYTSYPTAVEFETRYDEAAYRDRLAEADGRADEPLSFYVHLPFCDERCAYCGCNVVITKRREVSARYLRYLHREIDLLAAALPRRRRVSQYHWGGGTPTYLAPAEMRALHERVTASFDLDPAAEVAIEVDPRVTSPEQMALCRELGFNRVSLGVQDFDPRVQAAVNRNQSEAETRALYAECRRLGFASINLDLIYGLPLQNVEAFARTLDRVVELAPDRLAVYSYAHVPWLKAHQRRIDPATLPSPALKLRLFCMARDRLLGAGYVPIGMDHFARPDDEIALAVAERRLHRNFMGYTVMMGSDMVGVGLSAIGDVRASFAQNAKRLSDYYAALDAGRLPVERGYRLSEDDRIRRAVILGLMCNFQVDVREIERNFDVVFADYFAAELTELGVADGPVAHGFVHVAPDEIAIVGDGRLFLRNVCMIFDRHLRARDPGTRVFSRTV